MHALVALACYGGNNVPRFAARARHIPYQKRWASTLEEFLDEVQQAVEKDGGNDGQLPARVLGSMIEVPCGYRSRGLIKILQDYPERFQVDRKGQELLVSIKARGSKSKDSKLSKRQASRLEEFLDEVQEAVEKEGGNDGQLPASVLGRMIEIPSDYRGQGLKKILLDHPGRFQLTKKGEELLVSIKAPESKPKDSDLSKRPASPLEELLDSIKAPESNPKDNKLSKRPASPLEELLDSIKAPESKPKDSKLSKRPASPLEAFLDKVQHAVEKDGQLSASALGSMVGIPYGYRGRGLSKTLQDHRDRFQLDRKGQELLISTKASGSKSCIEYNNTEDSKLSKRPASTLEEFLDKVQQAVEKDGGNDRQLPASVLGSMIEIPSGYRGRGLIKILQDHPGRFQLDRKGQELLISTKTSVSKPCIDYKCVNSKFWKGIASNIVFIPFDRIISFGRLFRKEIYRMYKKLRQAGQET